MTTLTIHNNNPEDICQGVETTIQEGFKTISNQSSYAYEVFWGICSLNFLFQKKKLNVVEYGM